SSPTDTATQHKSNDSSGPSSPKSKTVTRPHTHAAPSSTPCSTPKRNASTRSPNGGTSRWPAHTPPASVKPRGQPHEHTQPSRLLHRLQPAHVLTPRTRGIPPPQRPRTLPRMQETTRPRRRTRNGTGFTPRTRRHRMDGRRCLRTNRTRRRLLLPTNGRQRRTRQKRVPNTLPRPRTMPPV